MIIIALTDIHGKIDYLPAISGTLQQADLVLIAGYITNFGGWDQAERIISSISQYSKQILAVSGNCDSPSVKDYLNTEGINLHCNYVNIEGVNFAGIGGSLPCPGRTLNESPDKDFQIFLASMEAEVSSTDPFVLMTHQPAWGTIVDTVGQDRHTGSIAIRNFIEKNKPLLVISGHIHEAVGVDSIGDTVLINPGPFRLGRYAYIQIEGATVSAEIRSVA